MIFFPFSACSPLVHTVNETLNSGIAGVLRVDFHIC